jgi:flagellar capping protein FliD
MFGTPGGQYNSLSAIGLSLSSSFQQAAASQSTSGGNPITTQTVNGTDGTFQPLNVQALQAALAANPTGVANLFSGFVNQFGTYLTNVTGVSTMTTTQLLGTPPSMSILQGFEGTIQSQVQNLQTQVKQIQDNANSQANVLRAQFVASESALAGYQALQQQLGSFFGNSSGH